MPGIAVRKSSRKNFAATTVPITSPSSQTAGRRPNSNAIPTPVIRHNLLLKRQESKPKTKEEMKTRKQKKDDEPEEEPEAEVAQDKDNSMETDGMDDGSSNEQRSTRRTRIKKSINSQEQKQSEHNEEMMVDEVPTTPVKEGTMKKGDETQDDDKNDKLEAKLYACQQRALNELEKADDLGTMHASLNLVKELHSKTVNSATRNPRSTVTTGSTTDSNNDGELEYPLLHPSARPLIADAEIAVQYLLSKQLYEGFTSPMASGGLAYSDSKAKAILTKLFGCSSSSSSTSSGNKPYGLLAVLSSFGNINNNDSVSIQVETLETHVGLPKTDARKILPHLRMIGMEFAEQDSTIRAIVMGQNVDTSDE